MALSEGFAHSQSTILAIQARPVANVTTLVVNDVRFLHSNLGPQRTGEIVLTVDGDTYTIRFVFTDEAIDQRTIQGHSKQRNPDTSEK